MELETAPHFSPQICSYVVSSWMAVRLQDCMLKQCTFNSELEVSESMALCACVIASSTRAWLVWIPEQWQTQRPHRASLSFLPLITMNWQQILWKDACMLSICANTYWFRYRLQWSDWQILNRSVCFFFLPNRYEHISHVSNYCHANGRLIFFSPGMEGDNTRSPLSLALVHFL